MRKRTASSATMLVVMKPKAASAMKPISASFTQRTNLCFGSLSASCPAVALKRKNGRMKMAPQMAGICAGVMPAAWIPLKVTRIIRAFLKKLSLNAPKNCVQNMPQKRRCPIRPI
jgi:hypothetical protein